MNKSKIIILSIVLNFISSNALLSCFGPADRFYGPNARTPHQMLNGVMAIATISTGAGVTSVAGKTTTTTAGTMHTCPIVASEKANTITAINAKIHGATGGTVTHGATTAHTLIPGNIAHHSTAAIAAKVSAIHNATSLITGKASVVAATVTGCTIS